MTRLHTSSPLALSLAALAAFHAPALWAADASFTPQSGDRVAFLGDSFMEREQYQGWLELAITTQFPERNVTFRNLGWSADTPAGASRSGLSELQAGTEGPDEGWKQLQKQLETYKPNVVFIGYGMASSLPGGQTPEDFLRDMERLLETLPKAAGNSVKAVLLGPPPRFDGSGDNKEEVAKHRATLAKIDGLLKGLAAKRNLPFISFQSLPQNAALTEDGIHLSSEGYRAVARQVEKSFGWKPGAWDQGDVAAALREHILRKNAWFFNRSRPANMAYIFGFRRGEQGRNAGEIPQFDALIEAEEKLIAKTRDLSKKVIVPEPEIRTESAVAAHTDQPLPKFTVADGYEISLWAENPMMHKPTQMNFDASGRLWVASSKDYPQVEVGQTADDQIIVLEDKDGDGKADTAKTFASGLLIPTAVIPGDGGCYVGQSTDLLHFKDTDGDGVADEKRRVLSGFGTEDTHHDIHTLQRGPDGKLWMNQSIYTRTDTETPHGLMRLRSGGIMRFDPHENRLTPMFFGWINAWGHQFDRYGQSFTTDGAGGHGINWAVPGAMYETYAGAEKILGSVSPGGYPKFASLEIVESTHFPADWQGSMITCDFRAHRVVRFGINDEGSGYAAQELGDVVRSEEVSFRPIDVKMGPDGALYVADWANPIINHGEVDFRDPRRDREHGRIWRITKKDSPLLPRQDISKLDSPALLKLLVSPNRYEREQATATLFEKPPGSLDQALAAFKAGAQDDSTRLAAVWASQNAGKPDFDFLEKAYAASEGPTRAAAIRVLADWAAADAPRARALLEKAVADEHPRVRLEAVRTLATLPGVEPLDLSLRVLDKPMDRFLNYALWLSVKDGGEEWLQALLGGKLDISTRGKGLNFALANLDAKKAEAIRNLIPKPLPQDGSGPWLDLVLRTGDAGALREVYVQLLASGFQRDAALRALRGLSAAATERSVKLPGDLSGLSRFIDVGDPQVQEAAVTLAGVLAVDSQLPRLVTLSRKPGLDPATQKAVIAALGSFDSDPAQKALLDLAGDNSRPALQRQAALALAVKHRATAVPLIAALSSTVTDPQEARAFWQAALAFKGISGELAKAFHDKPLDSAAAGLALQQVADVAEHNELLKVLREQAGSGAAKTYGSADVARYAKLAAETGDPARGERLFRRPALACTACHAIGGAGGKIGPDLTSIGASAPLDYLVESVLLPALKVKEGYHSVILETNDGRAIMGQLVRSADGALVIRDATGAETTVPEASISKKTDAGSLMPGNLTSTLTDQESADLFKFLSVLGKPGEYDATRSQAPRAWAVLPWEETVAGGIAKGDHALPWTPVNTAVDGSLWTDDVAPIAKDSKEVGIATKLQLSAAATVELQFPGTAPEAVWVDGEPVSDRSKASLSAGAHVIVVKYAPASAGKDGFLMKCTSGTFVADW